MKVVALECWFVGMFIRMMVDCLARLIFFLQCKHFVYLGCSLLSCFAASSTLSNSSQQNPQLFSSSVLSLFSASLLGLALVIGLAAVLFSVSVVLLSAFAVFRGISVDGGLM